MEHSLEEILNVDIDTVRTASQGTRMILVRITPSGSSVDVEIGSEATGRMVKDMVLEELEERQEIASAEVIVHDVSLQIAI